MHGAGGRSVVAGALAAAAFLPCGQSAYAACLAPGALPAAKPPHALRFGITPQLAGSAGAVQEPVAPEDPAKVVTALNELRPPGRDLILRLNRMFWSDGQAGLDRYAALVDGYARDGFRTELQVRYHPPAGHDGDIDGWVAYVRRAVQAFAPRRSVVELSITNEANLPSSPNTSDGTYKNVTDAIVRGVVAAREEADRLGRPDLAIGFTYAYRGPQDDSFFQKIGKAATPEFRSALDHIGIQAYPGIFFPPATTDPGKDMVDAITLLRTCLMPEAGIGDRTAIWVTENGYRTPGGQGEAAQASDLTATLRAVHEASGTLGVTDYRYFNLRDNNSHGTDLFDAVGLLFDDYSHKQSFGALRDAIATLGTTAPTPASAPPSLSVSVRPRTIRRGVRTRVRVRVKDTAGHPVANARIGLGRFKGRTGPAGRAVLVVRVLRRASRRTLTVKRAGYRTAHRTVRVRATRHTRV
jgi:hypothetical protein